MTAYRLWTLTCDGCGQIWDDGSPYSLEDVKRGARSAGWSTGRLRSDEDLCPNCADKSRDFHE